MFYIFLVYFFLFGVIIGSFLNVVILRHNTGKTVGGRSMCMSCKTILTAKNLVPVLSFLFQRGKCTHCSTKISWQYPLVELVTGILFALNFYMIYVQKTSVIEFITLFILSSTMIALLVAIFVYDLKHKIIPNAFSFPLAGLSILYILCTTFIFDLNVFWIPQGLQLSTLGMLNLCTGLIFYFGIYALWKFSNGKLIGLGDAKLLFTLGTVLGIVYGLSALFLSFWIGGVCAIFILLKQRLSKQSKHITMKSEIAFGPFLIIAFLIVYFFKIDVTNLSFILENFS
jgi:prepilin signal peptidase PulO-like enzyme (type II secretory pathway)